MITRQLSELEAFALDLAEWQEKQFGLASPDGSICHLMEEVAELSENPHDRLEFADCFMLLLGAHHRAGGTVAGLLEAGRDKLAICKARDWGTPEANGIVRHVPPSQGRFGED